MLTNVTSFRYRFRHPSTVPSRLKRYQHNGSYHFLTFSCYRRLALLNSPHAKQTFERELERARCGYRFQVFASCS